jgi:hypothetical protein
MRSWFARGICAGLSSDESLVLPSGVNNKRSSRGISVEDRLRRAFQLQPAERAGSMIGITRFAQQPARFRSGRKRVLKR